MVLTSPLLSTSHPQICLYPVPTPIVRCQIHQPSYLGLDIIFVIPSNKSQQLSLKGLLVLPFKYVPQYRSVQIFLTTVTATTLIQGDHPLSLSWAIFSSFPNDTPTSLLSLLQSNLCPSLQTSMKDNLKYKIIPYHFSN